MEPTKNEQETETLDEIKNNLNAEIVFTNKGEMVQNNRSYRRNFKSLWRSVGEERPSIRTYTKKKKPSKSKRKLERQNKKKGRR